MLDPCWVGSGLSSAMPGRAWPCRRRAGCPHPSWRRGGVEAWRQHLPAGRGRCSSWLFRAALPRGFRPPPSEAEAAVPRGVGCGRRSRTSIGPCADRDRGHGRPRQLREQQRAGLLRQAHQRLLSGGYRRLRELLQVREPRGPCPASPSPAPAPNGAFFLQRLRGRALRDHPGGARLHRRLPHHRQDVCG